MKKARSQKIHSERRSVERLGFVFDHSWAVSDIQNGVGEFVKKQSNRVSVWKIKQGGKEFYACYDKQRKTIATVLDEEPWD